MSRRCPVKLSTKNKNYDWINCIVAIHNLQCGCEKPLEHTVEEIFKQEPNLEINTEWHTTTTTDRGDNKGVEEDVLGEGDLSALFAEEFTEEDTTPSAEG